MQDLWGNKLYQQRARAAFPLLVRQAWAGQPIYYGAFAEELNMSNPRTLNYPLGTIGEALLALGASWGETIPPLQCLVLNKNTDLPGVGVDWAVPELAGYKSMSRLERGRLVDKLLGDVYEYNKWTAVLEALGLESAEPALASELLAVAARRGDTAESEAHRRLKKYVSDHPVVVELAVSAAPGEIEHPLPSGDLIDVLFRTKDEWVAVEVKAANAIDYELIRGLFQCVKYRALLKAVLAVEDRQLAARAILVSEKPFPEALIPLRNTLGITVFDRIIPS
jgi:hypothetical protein